MGNFSFSSKSKANKNWKNLGLLAFIFLFVGLVIVPAAQTQTAGPDFAGNNAFRNRWLEQDALVGATGIGRPYTWGPNVPTAPVTLSEDYKESPNGKRQVLYLDKARMELNNPSNGFVTAGLAVKELVSGQRQDGDTLFTQLSPSRTQVAGDPANVNPDAPVYESFRNLVTLGNADGNSKPSSPNAVITQGLDKKGNVSQITPPEQLKIGGYESITGHNIAQVFLDFVYQRGPITNPQNGQRVENQQVYTANPVSNVFGLAISEPFWVKTKIAQTERTVLVQLFERRVLTYNPALSGASKVEMGNVGQHYYNWRYVENATRPPASKPDGLGDEEFAFLNALNEYRRANNLPEFSINQSLLNAAKWQSSDMATKNYLGHVDSQGRGFDVRFTDFGYNTNTYIAENVAAGYETASDVLQGWKNSPGHNANMLNGNLRVIGISRVYNANSTYKWYWTTDFGGQ